MKVRKSLGRRLGVTLFACMATIGLSATAARAQTAGWEFAASAYLWMAGMHGKVHSGPADGARFDVGFGKIITSLDGVPVMASAEVRNGRFALMTDLIWLRLKDDLETRGVLFDDGSVRMSTVEFGFIGFYRAVDGPRIKLDAGGGGRLWSVKTRVKLNPGLLAGRSDEIGDTFVDPVVALRAIIGFTDDWSMTVYGDIGGFGVSSKLTWQALATINYRVNSWADVRLGYRYIAVDRSKIDVSLRGPILGGTFRF